jgi:hypothetical protein
MKKYTRVTIVAAIILSSLAPVPGSAEALLASPRGDARSLSAGSLKEEGAEKAVKLFGERGCLLIRSQERWAGIRKDLETYEWVRKSRPSVPDPDFTNSLVLGVFDYGDEAHRFEVRTFTNSNGNVRLDLAMSYVIYKKHVETPPTWNFIFLVVPKFTTLNLFVSTFNVGGGTATDKAVLEWECALGPHSGDTVDGLEATVTPENARVKAGEDIRLKFELQFKNHRKGDGREFAKEPEAVSVWDGKYSNGYRNHAFEVTTPDGKRALLRPALQDAWLKNVPHPVEVKDGTPYVLPGWGEGEVFKPLKALGLDTSQPGTYTITGIYMESADLAARGSDDKAAPLWGGTITTAPVTVEVVP